MRARKLYKKRVKSFNNYFKPDSFDTTGDIKTAMHKRENEVDSEELTRLYDGVRYGGIIPDAEYLTRMKKASKSAGVVKPDIKAD